MVERIKITNKRNKTGQHTNNHWNGHSTDKKGSQLEMPRARWSARLLAAKFSYITWQNGCTNGWHD